MEQLFFGDLIQVDSKSGKIPVYGKHESATYIIVSANVVNEYMHSVIVCPLVSTPHFKQSRIGATYVPREISGLDEHKTINYFEMITVAKDQISKRIGALPNIFLSEIRESLKAIFDIY